MKQEGYGGSYRCGGREEKVGERQQVRQVLGAEVLMLRVRSEPERGGWQKNLMISAFWNDSTLAMWRKGEVGEGGGARSREEVTAASQMRSSEGLS